MGTLGLSTALGAAVAADALAGRRLSRRRLNRALHELRRPLQALALAEGHDAAGEWIAQARAALGELDREVNGALSPARTSASSAAELFAAARRRWARIGAVALTEVSGEQDPAPLEVDVAAVGSALDNLIANALEHGRGPVLLRATADRRNVRLEVRNRGPLRHPHRSADPRRGHGLLIAARIAAEHGGRLRAPVEKAGTVRAAIELPRGGGD